MELTAAERESAHLSYLAFRESTVTAPPKAFMQKIKGKIPDALWESMNSVTNEQLALVTKLARAVPEDEFVAALATNEWPPIKLTPAELELVKGGKFDLKGFIIGAALGAVTATSAGLTVGAALLATGVECGITAAATCTY